MEKAISQRPNNRYILFRGVLALFGGMELVGEGCGAVYNGDFEAIVLYQCHISSTRQ